MAERWILGTGRRLFALCLAYHRPGVDCVRQPGPLEPKSCGARWVVGKLKEIAWWQLACRINLWGRSPAQSTNKVEQLFTLGFALDQSRNDLNDLERCVREQKTV